MKIDISKILNRILNSAPKLDRYKFVARENKDLRKPGKAPKEKKAKRKIIQASQRRTRG